MGANRIIILIAIALIASAICSSASAKEIIAGNDSEASFGSIQEAVNNSLPGDTILVLPGVYKEEVDVRVEGLSILSESGNPGDTTVTSFIVSENNITVSGFTINGGIEGEECFNCIFSDNMFSGSGILVYPGGVTTNIIIANNTIQGGSISLAGSSGNRIINNTISNTISDTEDSHGINFIEAHSNYIADNHISSSKYGISMVRLSSNNEIVNNTLTSNDIGVMVTDVALGNNITGNIITDNNIGIWQEYSWGNLVTENNVSQNKEYGVYLNLVSFEAPYTGTSLFYNNIFNNTVNLFNDTSNQYTVQVMNSGAGTVSVIWNTTKTPGTNIAGGPYLGGNYWAKPDGTGFSQNCNDWDSDGICDSIYTMSANDIDYLPLTILSDQQLVFPVANFSTNVSSGYVPLSVLFTDLSENATSRSWDFDNDGNIDSTDANPVYVYIIPGTYTVNLTVSNANGTVSRLSSITAFPAPPVDGFILKEAQITTDKSNQSQPAIYGNRIVWNDDRNRKDYTNIYDLYLYDLSTSKEARIKSNGSFPWKPAIYEDRVVWQEYQYNKSINTWDKSDIYMYNLSTSKETRITTSGKAHYPDIYGNRIVWTDIRSGKGDIYMYDLSTSREIQITTDKAHQSNAAIYRDIIVWEDSRNGDGYNPTDIYMYNISASEEIQVTADDSDQYSPDIYEDKIVWADLRNRNWDIYMYNLSTSTETRITTDNSQQEFPKIYGNRIVWHDSRNGNYDIYMYNSSTQEEIRITTNRSDQIYPVIYGNRIVWTDYRNEEIIRGRSYINADIYMCTVLGREPEPELPVADFFANVTSGAAPLKVLFTDNSTGSPTSWLWDFGDGIHSKHSMNATHTFTKPGKYNISLTVRNEYGNNITTKQGYITVTDSKAPVPDFSANVLSGNAPLKVVFTDKSKGVPTSWLWDFGDGIHSKHAMNATHTFTKPGKYNISLTVTNNYGSNTVLKPGYITVTDSKAPIADFSVSVLSGDAPLKVVFTDKSKGVPTSWLWDFGDGIHSKHSMNATHTFTKPGTYNITLTVTNSAGSSSITRPGYITVTKTTSAVKPVADFYSPEAENVLNQPSDHGIYEDEAVSFFDNSTGSPTSWLWDFGDGSTSTQKNATHVYGKMGGYTVNLTVKNAAGSDMISKYGYVLVGIGDEPASPAYFSSDVRSGKAPLAVTFVDDKDAEFPNYPIWRQWDFGDGVVESYMVDNNESATPYATHTYEKPGKYTVTLYLDNRGGKSIITKYHYITVTAPDTIPDLPVANFSANVTSGNAPLVVKFTDTGTGGNPTSWLWDFGDGIYSKHAMNATHTYTKAGVYNVTLTVKNDAGSNTVKKTGYISIEANNTL